MRNSLCSTVVRNSLFCFSKTSTAVRVSTVSRVPVRGSIAMLYTTSRFFDGTSHRTSQGLHMWNRSHWISYGVHWYHGWGAPMGYDTIIPSDTQRHDSMMPIGHPMGCPRGSFSLDCNMEHLTGCPIRYPIRTQANVHRPGTAVPTVPSLRWPGWPRHSWR